MASTKAKRRELTAWTLSVIIGTLVVVSLAIVEVGAFLQTGEVIRGDSRSAIGFWGIFILAAAVLVTSVRRCLLVRRELEILEGPWEVAKTR